ncbi:MAG: hypothetical protein JRJ60_23245, partial [Deltaproteobacteria bacterium]|nr:hypothetical protein [Deltaproteobacteria bacterium]
MRKDIGKHSVKRGVAVIGLLILAVFFAVPGSAWAQATGSLSVQGFTTTSPVCEGETFTLTVSATATKTGGTGNFCWRRTRILYSTETSGSSFTAFNSGDHSGVACIDHTDVCDSTNDGSGVSGSRDFDLTAPAGMKRIRIIALAFGSCFGGEFHTRPLVADFSTDAGEDKTTCAGTPVQFDQVQTTGGTGTFTYSWSPSTYLNSDTSQQPIATPSGTCTPSSSITYT